MSMPLTVDTTSRTERSEYEAPPIPAINAINGNVEQSEVLDDAVKQNLTNHTDSKFSSDTETDKTEGINELKDIESLEIECQRCKFRVPKCKSTTRLLRNRLQTHLGPAIALVILIVVAVYELAYGSSCDNILGEEYYMPIQTSTPAECLTENSFKVLLFGDSLVSRTSIDLVTTIKSFLPDYNLEFSVKSYWGTGVGKLKEHMPAVIQNATAEMGGIDAVIFCWDTDSSDTDWKHMDKTDKVQFRDQYIADLAYMVKYITAKVPRMAIAGPEVSGEGPLFAPNTFNHVEYEYVKFRLMFEASRLVNRAISELYTLPYIDIRQAFLDHIPWYRWGFKGCLTVDGEHENARGTLVVAKLFAETINGWINIAYTGRSGNSTGTTFDQPKYISFLYPETTPKA